MTNQGGVIAGSSPPLEVACSCFCGLEVGGMSDFMEAVQLALKPKKTRRKKVGPKATVGTYAYEGAPVKRKAAKKR